MAKLRLVYRCTECAGSHPKWSGRCITCGAWNSLVEDVEGPEEPLVSLAAGMSLVAPGEAKPITEVDGSIGQPQPTTIPELDRVLGGGIVPGSVTLLGGESSGKTALAQALVFDGIEAVEDRQLRVYRCPSAIGNRVASQQAALAPGLERPHGARLVSHPVRGCSS